MPAKSTKASETAKPARRAARKRSPVPRTSRKAEQPEHSQIAERAYFIHLEEGSLDEVENWLRAEHELRAA
ncbi:MAG TPA: DUF2934 domain-containing protein [Solirubrobacteraceae bacterium]|nr:DUF2934 domain-containing protein [Solirubrobacteraceae bacterium]